MTFHLPFTAIGTSSFVIPALLAAVPPLDSRTVLKRATAYIVTQSIGSDRSAPIAFTTPTT